MIKRSNGNSWQTEFGQISEKKTHEELFSDEIFFDIDGVYNSQNEHVWAINRANANEKDGVI